jgi:asparagine synthase (glutamine-hydrolysing)
MCGILSLVGPPGAAEEAALGRGLTAMRHRGPDGSGLWINADRSVGLGHVRLAVIDVGGGAQPLANEDGAIVAVVNGEFYGYEAIRRDLANRGHRLSTQSDSETAVHLYEDHGLDFLSHLRGEFALLLWDSRRQRLVAARDRYGAKPLVWRHDGRRLLAASEAKALFPLGVVPAWDDESMWQICGMQYTLPDRTLCAGVRQLRPGHVLTYENGMVVTRPYRRLDFRPEVECDADSAPQLAAELDDAVSVRLRADVPICFHLSGGLDSSTLVALAMRHLPAPPVCFAVGFEEATYDELTLARETALHLGAALHELPLTSADLVAHLADAVYFAEGLAINGHLAAKYLLARAIRAAGFKVVLSGEGSDEILGGYAHFRQDFLEANVADGLAELRAANALVAGIHLPEGDGLSVETVRMRLGFVPAFLRAKATLGQRLRRLLRPEFVARFAGHDPFDEFLDAFDPGLLAGRHQVNQSAFLWSQSALATSILRTLGDGTEMAHGVEGRLPFLDHHLFAFVRRLPIGLKIRDGVEKWILRAALGAQLPAAVRDRRKHPFTAPPIATAATGPGREFCRDHLAGELADSPFFDSTAVLGWLDELATATDRERVAADPALMLVLTSVLWQGRGLKSSEN